MHNMYVYIHIHIHIHRCMCIYIYNMYMHIYIYIHPGDEFLKGPPCFGKGSSLRSRRLARGQGQNLSPGEAARAGRSRCFALPTSPRLGSGRLYYII